jgi:hypothetical protein
MPGAACVRYRRRCKWVSLDMVKRAMLGGGGEKAESQAMLGMSVNRTFANPMGDLYLTSKEVNRLRGRFGQSAGSVVLSSHAFGFRMEPWNFQPPTLPSGQPRRCALGAFIWPAAASRWRWAQERQPAGDGGDAGTTTRTAPTTPSSRRRRMHAVAVVDNDGLVTRHRCRARRRSRADLRGFHRHLRGDGHGLIWVSCKRRSTRRRCRFERPTEDADGNPTWDCAWRHFPDGGGV